MLPSAILRSQARFQRRALISGRPLLFTFCKPYSRLGATGEVVRPSLGTARAHGIASFGTLPSDLKEEIVQKWGKTFSPDGYLEFPESGFPAPAEAVASVTDLRSGDTWDVIYVFPSALVEDRCRALFFRRQPVYNRLVSVRDENPTDNTQTLILSSLPCRISPLDTGLSDFGESDLPGLLTGTVALECPYVYADGIAAGVGVAPAPAGSGFTFDPKGTVVVDDPAAYGGYGPVMKYRVASLPIDMGGDRHHSKHLLTLR